MSCRVFIVEDQDVVREMLARYIDLQADLEVCGSAATGEQALQILPSDTDVVVMDLGLDGMSGAELLSAIQKTPSAPPCVILSGGTALELAAPLLDSGAAAYVEKGDLAHLLAAIREAVV